MGFDISHFHAIDYIAVAGTLLFSICIGLYYGFVTKQTKEEMLLGGRNMSVWPVALSMIASYLSAISVQGYPAEVYSYGISVYHMTTVAIFLIPLAIVVYVKIFYSMKLISIYEYFEHRFDSVAVRWLASLTFICQICLVNAIILFAPAIALETILGFPFWISITGIGLIGTVYTAVGGIKAVVWTDFFQFIMIIVGLMVIMTKGFISSGGIAKAFQIASEKGRMELFDFSLDPFMRHNVFNFVFGYGFYYMFWFGTHPPMVQRYCSLPTFSAATKALLLTIPINLFISAVMLFTGISITATYASCCPVLLGEISRADAIISYFVIKELTAVYGMMGLFVSCIFSGVLSSVSSSLNSLSAVTWEDFVSKGSYFKNLNASGQAQCTKVIAGIYGIICIGLAFLIAQLGNVYPLVFKFSGAAAGPIGGLFLCSLFLPFMNKHGAMVGAISGIMAVMYIVIESFILSQEYTWNPTLPTDLSNCPEGTNFTAARNYTSPEITNFDYPTKIFTMSYTLYPLVGAIITTTIGIAVSVATGGLSKSHKVGKKYLHPSITNFAWVQKFLKEEKENDFTIANNNCVREKEKSTNIELTINRINQNN